MATDTGGERELGSFNSSIEEGAQDDIIRVFCAGKWVGRWSLGAVPVLAVGAERQAVVSGVLVSLAQLLHGGGVP